jgi:hypothetical protein
LLDGKRRTPMPNYYYDAPPDFTSDLKVTFKAKMEQPAEGYVHLGNFVSQGEAHFGRKQDGGKWEILTIKLPYPLGARVGVREVWSLVGSSILKQTAIVYKRDVRTKGGFRFWSITPEEFNWQPASTMPDDAIRHWYTVTEVDVVNQDGQWVEKVTMRRDG